MVHEWALAEAVIETISSIARERGIKKIKKVILAIGVLQSIDLDVFKTALDILNKDIKPSIEEFIFEEEEARFQCIKCGFQWSLSDVKLSDEEREAIHFLPEAVHAYIKCPRCGSLDYKILSGRGVLIKRIEGYA